jgi:dTMP kinase
MSRAKKASSERIEEASPNAPGRLIVIEGIDGAGKSTLARSLAEELERRGVDCVLSREPTDGPHGRRIRELARGGAERLDADAETELFIEDRRDHVRDVIAPALAAGRVVILDRYYYSTVAYQGARGVDPDAILERHRAFAPEPDFVFLLEIDVERALDRVRRSRGDRPDHFERAESLRAVAERFARIRHPRLVRLDAEKPIEEILKKALAALPLEEAPLKAKRT